MDTYLYERYREDRIERDLEVLMCLNRETQVRQSAGCRIFKVMFCETCPFFEGWVDPLGMGTLRCKLYDVVIGGASSSDLFKQVHGSKAQISLTITSDSHGAQ